MNHKYLWIFLLSSFVLVSSSPDSLQDPQYVLKGQEINFLPSLPGKPDRVGWIHEGRDVVWFDPQTGKEDVSPSYKDRITLEQDSPRLTIKDATYKDSGNYDLKLMINDQHHHLKYRIEVIDKVDQPHISCVLTSPNRALLVCSTDSKHPDLLEFKWSSDGKEHPGPNLQINVRRKHDDRVYRCDVSNPLTKETANFTAGDCFLEPFEKTKKRIRRSPCNTPDVSQDLKYVLKGQEINFKPPIPEKPVLIIWFYHDGRGVVLFDDKGELNFPSYKDRIILNHNTAELTINNATYEDSGNYTLRWNINNEECRLKYPVEVIDIVTKPNISCKMVNQNQAFLECLTEGESDPLLKFKWRSQGYEQTGSILEINLSDEQDVYHCDMSNPLTNETASFLAKDCFRNNIPKVEIPYSTDWIYCVTIGAVGCLVTILGYIVCRKFSYSERLYFQKQETTEVESPTAAIEMTPSVTLGTNPTRKQNLGSAASTASGKSYGPEQTLSPMRLVVLGWRRPSASKSLTANTILGREEFRLERGAEFSMTRHTVVAGRRVTVVNTPGWYSSQDTPFLYKMEIAHGATLCPPGPHAFLLVIPVGMFTVTDRIRIEEHMGLFGERVWRHVLVVFTWTDVLQNISLEGYIHLEGAELQCVLDKCRRRYILVNNCVLEDQKQVVDLMECVDQMVAEEGGHYLLEEDSRVLDENQSPTGTVGIHT